MAGADIHCKLSMAVALSLAWRLCLRMAIALRDYNAGQASTYAVRISRRPFALLNEVMVQSLCIH
jgi:hypothetical protein